MEVIIDNIKYETTQLDNGKWTLPEEIKKCLRSCCGALNIDGNRVGTESRLNAFAGNKGTGFTPSDNRDEKGKGMFNGNADGETETTGRYPSQTFINSETAQVLDMQSGISKGSNKLYCYSGKEYDNKDTSMFNGDKPQAPSNFNDTGGCSKILHKCDFEKGECDLYFYNPKVSKSERNAGCDAFDEKLSASSEFRPNHLEKTLNGEGGNPYGRWKPLKNNHPTLKPIKLNKNILALFKTPNEQRIVYPFAGSGSEIIGGIKAGFNNWCGCEINQDYIDIALARIEYWSNFEGCEVPETTEVAEGQIDIWEML